MCSGILFPDGSANRAPFLTEDRRRLCSSSVIRSSDQKLEKLAEEEYRIVHFVLNVEHSGRSVGDHSVDRDFDKST